MQHLATRPSTARLVLVPALISLAVTLLRLVGELQHWPKPLVNSDVCGKAILGVTWLVPIFAAYFAITLLNEDKGPRRLGLAIALAVSGLILKLAGTFVMESGLRYPQRMSLNLFLTVAALGLQFVAWPALSKVLLAYGYAARVPVGLVQFLAMRGHWGTHYDALDPAFPPLGFWPTYLRVSLIPNIFFMEAYTVIVGTVLATILIAILRRFRWGSRLGAATVK